MALVSCSKRYVCSHQRLSGSGGTDRVESRATAHLTRIANKPKHYVGRFAPIRRTNPQKQRTRLPIAAVNLADVLSPRAAAGCARAPSLCRTPRPKARQVLGADPVVQLLGPPRLSSVPRWPGRTPATDGFPASGSSRERFAPDGAF